MFRSILSAAALLLLASPAAAQGWIEIEHPRGVTTVDPQLRRVSADVRVTLEGRIAHVEVEERFQNTGGRMAEGSYLYPMPGEAVFQNFSLWIGEQEVRGEMMNAEQARGIYEEIVRRQKDPALLTLAGHGLVRAQVFPIQPGETRKIVLRYTQLLERAGDALRLRYAFGARGPQNGSLSVTLPEGAGIGTPYSPTHTLSTTRNGERTRVTLDATTGGDLELFLPLRQGLVGMTALPHAESGEDGYVMLLLAPALRQEGAVVPRDLTFVVDVSGSMSGQKLEQARAAVRQALGTLRPEDRFRLIAFSSGVHLFREEFAAATGGNLRAGRQFIDGLNADGGTNISGALDAALGATVAENRLPIVFFLTDGVPSVGEQEPDRIAAMAAGHIGRNRVFTIGVGHDVNTYLLDRLAQEGHGAVEYVAPEADVEVAVGNLVGKLSRPALVNLRLIDSPVRFVELTPGTLPDLFFGEEMVVFGRYQGSGSGDIVIEGERNGRRERFVTSAVFPRIQPANDFIPRLWASRRIGDLTRQVRLEGNSTATIQQIRDLGLRYGILTEYTSYLVQEPQLAVGGTGVGRRRDMMPMSAPAAVAAPSPTAQTGAVAFDRAQESGRMSQASNLAEADQLADAKAEKLSGAGPATRRAGSRVFAERDGVWTDIAHTEKLRIVSIAPFSPAYFAVTRALPELAASLKVGDQVLIAGRRASVRIATDGVESLSLAEVERLVREFRRVA
ncbi:MAG: VIT domain-containing protein [Gemmatimonadales bacterium]